ncbi:predicted protein [Naegleria gruberi]|uniref:Predicted protein n=1 Tax=Naegleria gruberi TaxID=5762 RepID=D2VXT9_NAEGR|nr:uncharacterized protein NAEGRDRAFT_73871 [Naegleria gruberi]EFC38349.1 predicted protein [Naegleria gruberi]|eukprot:XP_002671093.1 predicted protein [Naegleria gruberi strain NEG-M]
MLSRWMGDIFDEPFGITTWDPFLSSGGGTSDRNRGGVDFYRNQLGSFTPSTDVSETDKCICVKSNLPGLKKEDVRIDVDDEKRLLTFSGETKSEKTDENEIYHRSERYYGKFSRSMRLPQNVDLNGIKANMNEGVLNISIPKVEQKEKQVKTRSIGVD